MTLYQACQYNTFSFWPKDKSAFLKDLPNNIWYFFVPKNYTCFFTKFMKYKYSLKSIIEASRAYHIH
jgi:hypothetical protein